jgi:hypothetical protein
MILLMLRDGTLAEIPQGNDIIHRRQTLMCLDRNGEVITSMDATEVLAYTCSEAAARRVLNDTADLEESEKAQPNGGNGSTHMESNGASRSNGGSHATQHARHR